MNELARRHWAFEPGLVFLNHGSFGACPAPVRAAQQALVERMERNPVAFLGRESGALLRQARQALGRMVGAEADDLAWVPNSTTGVNLVAHSVALAPGDEVLGTDHEYGACVATWQRACRRQGARYVSVAVPLPFEPGGFAGRVWAAVTPRTRLIFLSQVTSTTALVFPLAELCRRAHEAGIAVLVDAAHVPGQLPLHLDETGADFTVGNTHKWLCAPKGSAFLHVRRDRHALIEADVVSWGYVAAEAGTAAGHTGFAAYTGDTLLEQRLQWQGTRDLSAFLAVPAALQFHHEVLAGEAPRCRALAAALLQQACARSGLPSPAPAAALAQMAPIPVRCADAEGLRRRLFERHHIEVPVTQHGGQTFVRASIAAYNDEDDVQRLLAALVAEGVL
jgi:isopenicillin-N epimerase